jgi:putative endonuclease
MTRQTSTQARRKAERWGRLAEGLCVLRLRLTGWQILSRRMSSHRGTGLGEIDIVARRGKVIAFVEVKARASLEQALEAVTLNQQRRIARAATMYLARRPDLADCSARFDVMTVGPRFLPLRLADAWRP